MEIVNIKVKRCFGVRRKGGGPGGEGGRGGEGEGLKGGGIHEISKHKDPNFCPSSHSL